MNVCLIFRIESCRRAYVCFANQAKIHSCKYLFIVVKIENLTLAIASKYRAFAKKIFDINGIYPVPRQFEKVQPIIVDLLFVRTFQVIFPLPPKRRKCVCVIIKCDKGRVRLTMFIPCFYGGCMIFKDVYRYLPFIDFVYLRRPFFVAKIRNAI